MTDLLDILGTIALSVGAVLWVAIYRSGVSSWREEEGHHDSRYPKDTE